MRYLNFRHRGNVGRDFLSSIGFVNEVAGHSVKIMCWVPDVSVSDLGQALSYSRDGFICQVLRVAKPLGDEDSYQAGANGFVFPARNVAVRIQPGQQGVEWFLCGSQLTPYQYIRLSEIPAQDTLELWAAVRNSAKLSQTTVNSKGCRRGKRRGTKGLIRSHV